jgi:hypothetical protein
VKLASRIVLVVALVILVAAVALYAALPLLARPALTAELEGLGFTDVEVSLGRPGWDHIQIRRVAVTMYAEGIRVRARLSGARLDYRPALLRHGRVDAVHLGTLEVTVEPSDVPVPPTETAVPLPGPWITELPFAVLSVDRLHIAHRSADGAERIVDLSGALHHEAGALQGSFEISDGAAPRVVVDAGMTAQGEMTLVLREPGGASAGELGARFVAAADGRARTSGHIRIEPAALAKVLGSWTGGAWVVPAKGSVQVRWQGDVPANLAAGAEALVAGSELSAHADVDLASDEVAGVGRALAAKAAADLALTGGRLSWTLAKGSMLSGEPEALRAPGPAASLPRSSTLTSTRPLTGSMMLAGDMLSSLRLQGAVDLDVNADEIEDVGRALRLKAGLELALQGRSLRWRLAEGSTLSGELRALRKADDAGDALPKVATVTLTAPLPGTLTAAGDRVDLAVPAGGAVKLQALEYADVVVPEASARLTGPVALSYRSADDWRMGEIHLALAAPVLVTKLKALAKLDQPRVDVQMSLANARATPSYTLRDASVGVLGGRVSVAEFRYQADRPSPPFEVAVRGIDLAKVVGLEQQVSLQASGLLDGSLPVEIVAEGGKVSGGAIHSRSPGGVIRFIPSEDARRMAAGNPALKLAYDALSNLQYQTLDASVEYSPAGDLELGIQLKGRNPDWQHGRPIHLNLNVVENIPTLLRSLELGDNVSGVIEKRIQEFYKQRQKQH